MGAESVHKITAHVPSLTCFSYTGGLCLMNEYLNTNIMTAMLLLSFVLFALFLFFFIYFALFVPRNSTIDKTTGTTGICGCENAIRVYMTKCLVIKFFVICAGHFQ